MAAEHGKKMVRNNPFFLSVHAEQQRAWPDTGRRRMGSVRSHSADEEYPDGRKNLKGRDGFLGRKKVECS